MHAMLDAIPVTYEVEIEKPEPLPWGSLELT
jgi:hypothetical protein